MFEYKCSSISDVSGHHLLCTDLAIVTSTKDTFGSKNQVTGFAGESNSFLCKEQAHHLFTASLTPGSESSAILRWFNNAAGVIVKNNMSVNVWVWKGILAGAYILNKHLTVTLVITL